MKSVVFHKATRANGGKVRKDKNRWDVVSPCINMNGTITDIARIVPMCGLTINIIIIDIAMGKGLSRGEMSAQQVIPTQKNTMASLPIAEGQILRPGRSINSTATHEIF